MRDTKKTGFFKKEVKITMSGFFLAALIYLTLPVIIFFVGYLRPLWAVVFSGLTVFSVWWAWHDMAGRKPDKELSLNERVITLNRSYFLFLIPFVLVILYLGGVGEFSWCLRDHRVRYAILYDLVKYKWPVIYDFSTQQNPAVAEILGEGKVAFAYYFVFWMVPAVIGKIFGVLAARIVLLLWSAAGLSLVAIGAVFLYGKQSRFLFVALMLFAGFDVFPYYYRLYTGFNPGWEDWTLHFRLFGNFYQIMNVFNQCIPGWLITVLLLLCVRSRFVGLLGSLMFCYSPWAAIGILPMCIVKLIETNRGSKAKEVLKNLFTAGNMIAPVVFFVCFASFYRANPNAAFEYGFIWKFYKSPLVMVAEYIAFVVFEFGIWALLVFKKHKKDWMFYCSIATMLIIPIYKMSGANDFLMRGSLAPHFVIALYASMFASDGFNEMMEKENRKIRPRLKVLSLLVAAYTSINLLIMTALLTTRTYAKLEPEEDVTTDIGSFGDVRNEDYLEMVRVQFYVYDYEDTLFFKYLAKK